MATKIYIGSNESGESLRGHIKSLTFYPASKNEEWFNQKLYEKNPDVPTTATKLVGYEYLDSNFSVSRSTTKTYLDKEGIEQTSGLTDPVYAWDYGVYGGTLRYVGLNTTDDTISGSFDIPLNCTFLIKYFSTSLSSPDTPCFTLSNNSDTVTIYNGKVDVNGETCLFEALDDRSGLMTKLAISFEDYDETYMELKVASQGVGVIVSALVEKTGTFDTITLSGDLSGSVTELYHVDSVLSVTEMEGYINEVGLPDFNDVLDVFVKPDMNSSIFSKQSASSVCIKEGVQVNVGNVIVGTTGDTVLSLDSDLDTGSKFAGTDYYVYALNDGEFIISANNTYPVGYNEYNSRKIGGFHYGVIPEDFGAVNNIAIEDAEKIRGINEHSFWDLKWKPVSAPEGMVKVGNKWYDIYLLNSEHIVNGTSKADTIIAGGQTTYGRAIPKVPLAYGGYGSTTYGSFTWYEACEIANAYSKTLISYEEFQNIAYGVNEGASSGDSDATIKHIADHTSKWGICQATGHQWIWGSDIGGNRDEGSTSWDWRTGLTEGRGDMYMLHDNHVTAVRLGGYWIYGSYSGSRCSHWNTYPRLSGWDLGARLASDHLSLV